MATYYVAQTSAGTGDGSSYANRMSVASHNAGSFAAGDLIYLVDTITSTIIIPNGGDAANQVVIDGSYTGHASLLSGWDSYCAILLNQKSFVTFQNININCNKATNPSGDPQNGGGIIVIGSSNLIFDNNEIQQSQNGIHFKHISYPGTLGRNDDLLFTNNYIHDQPSSGITLLMEHADIIIGGTIDNGNTFKDIGYTAIGNKPEADVRVGNDTDGLIVSYNHMYAEAASDRGMAGVYANGSDNILIEYNTIHGHNGKGARPAITLKADDNWITSGAVVRFNHIYDYNDTDAYIRPSAIHISMDWEYVYVYGNMISNTSVGINFNKGWQSENNSNGLDPKEGHCWGNIINNVENDGIVVTGSGTDIIESLYINNNVIYNAATNPADSYRSGMYLAGSENVVLKNNIVMDSRDNEVVKYEIYGNSPSGTPSLSHTLYYRTNDITPQVYDDTNSSCKPCDWNSVNNLFSGTGDLSDNPLFNDIVNEDFSLASGSPCIDNGASIVGPQNIPAAVVALSGNFSYADCLDPSTNFSTIPPTIVTANQNNHGTGWDIGAYVYGDAASPYTRRRGILRPKPQFNQIGGRFR